MPTTCPYHIDPTGADIHAEAAALREQGPAARVVLPDGIPAWSVTDPRLIKRLTSSNRVSKDAHQHWPLFKEGKVPTDWSLGLWVAVRNALTAFGPEHTRLRRPLASAFSPRRVRAMVPQIETITATLLDELATAGPDTVVDLRDRFAFRLPLLVVNVVLGVPDDMHAQFRDAVGGLFDTSLSPQEAAASESLVRRHVDTLIERKRDEPAEDVTSTLIAAREAGELTDRELQDSFILLIGAGHETTVNLLDHACTNLLADPAQLELAMTGEVPWENVVEETLRHQAPIATILPRFAVENIVDQETGIQFSKGDLILINYAAAGRAPRRIQRPDEFDIRRTDTQHLAFGHGAHLCLGAELARIESRIALSALFARFPAMRLAEGPDQLKPIPSFISNGHQRLPVHLGDEARQPE
ncbi:cytochrome P450 [Streptomyces diastaticus]|uniref:cytochrome P450 family protein n=1 Tax=Streptomyces diastaticus TaxID=1956 RepID=UPI0033CD97FA